MAGKSLNKVTLIGHVGKDPELRYTNSGVAWASFSLATNENKKDQASGQWVEHTEWHNIKAWDKLAEICNQYAKKGKQIYVEGKLQTRKYEDKDGVTKYTTDIIAHDIILLGGGGAQSGEGQGSYN